MRSSAGWIVFVAAFIVGCESSGRAELPSLTSLTIDPSSSSSSRSAPNEIRWGFEDVGDLLHGNFEIGSRNGGEIEPIRPGAGNSLGAVRFPAFCEGDACARAVIFGVDGETLDPAQQPFAFGAAVLVHGHEISALRGSNVMQKGLATTAQWKLQIDGGGEGKPSCVLRRANGEHPIVVESSVGVADGRWHRVVCQRSQTALAIVVDGEIVAATRIPDAYSVDTAGHRMSVGGNGTHIQNDQYHGALDDVFFALYELRHTR